MDQDDFDHVAQGIGLRPFDPKKTEDEKSQLGELKYNVENRINAEQEQRKRLLTRDEKMQIMRETVDDKVMKHNMIMPDEKVPLVLLPKGAQANAYVMVGNEKIKLSDVPPNFRAQAITQRRSMGLSTSEEAIARLWVQNRDKNKKRPATP